MASSNMTAAQRIADHISRQTRRQATVRPGAIVSYLEMLHSRADRASALAWLQTTYPDLYADVAPHMPQEPDCIVIYTTAPIDYDGFGTETLAVVGTFDNKPLRKVETPTERVTWQRMCYESGLHCAMDETEFAKAAQCPWFVPADKSL